MWSRIVAASLEMEGVRFRGVSVLKQRCAHISEAHPVIIDAW